MPICQARVHTSKPPGASVNQTTTGSRLGHHAPYSACLRKLTSVVIMQVAFDGIGSMPMARIENYRQVKQEAVEYEMKRRNARKNLDHALIASPEDSHVMQVEGEPLC